ncbi:hypothetical protein [Sanguibacter suaedae]|uniref:Uncharacterized protein n=1 Tax=Sanguibacter suaedae TaxID=2795737 RepID=A0A934I353_9MICO|nr:hypothetical protein [Sanguibacter suaedae]MBI9114724.1 hypothetical protein [Sanguibacter suaedae]
MSRRLLLALPAGLCLLAGLDAALLLLGLPAPVTTDRLPVVHGVLLVLGFVGTLVALERAVALRRTWGYLAPVLLGSGGLALLSPLPLGVGQAALVCGSLALGALYVPLYLRGRDDAVVVQALGAALATGGALLWATGVPVPDVLPWLAGFIVLTIVGERLELARVVLLARGTVDTVLALCLALVVGVTAGVLWPAVGTPLLGAALLGIVGWLTVHDVARRTVRSTGLPRFMAVCLLAGYAWLAAAGATWFVLGRVGEGPAYDAVVHAVFLGFTLSMIMAHAPVILPAVLTVRLPYHPVMLLPAGLLHASLVVRVVGGDAWGLPGAHTAGGALNVVAVLLFVVVAAASAVRGTRGRAPRTVPATPLGTTSAVHT